MTIDRHQPSGRQTTPSPAQGADHGGRLIDALLRLTYTADRTSGRSGGVFPSRRIAMGAQDESVARALQDARGGSREALGCVLESCRGYLLQIAWEELDPALRAKGGASDLVQETFLKAQRHFAQFQGQ